MTPFYLVVADDHIDLCQLLQTIIRAIYQDKVHLKIVYTVPELMECLMYTQPIPDLLLLDYNLRPIPFKAPDVLKWIQDHRHLQGMPVDVWSSLPDGPEAESCRQLGARSFTSKSDVLGNMPWFVNYLVEQNRL